MDPCLRLLHCCNKSTTTNTQIMRRAMAAAMHTEAKIAELGLKLPSHPRPVAAYVMCQRVGNIIYTAGSYHAQADPFALESCPKPNAAGHLPQPAEGPLIVGKVRAAWRLCFESQSSVLNGWRDNANQLVLPSRLEASLRQSRATMLPRSSC